MTFSIRFDTKGADAVERRMRSVFRRDHDATVPFVTIVLLSTPTGFICDIRATHYDAHKEALALMGFSEIRRFVAPTPLGLKSIARVK